MTPSRRLALVVSLATGLGCGGGRARTAGDAAPVGDAADAGAGDGATSDGVPDGAAADADAADAPPKPAPVASPASRLLVPGVASLVGSGADSCTNAPGATGDRWCAFGRPAGDTFELWAFDATKAATGASIACDGTDASCQRVSQHLYENRMTGYADAGFNGDTLIYGENPYKGDATGAFVGAISAWRPGWAAGRKLTGDLGVSCVGQARSDAAMCFENRLGDGVNADLTIELHAGRLADATTTTLPLVDTLILAATTDAPGAPARCQFELAPDGGAVAWSTRAKGDPVETLHALPLVAGAATAAPAVVARDVSRWAISPDGLAWYWLAGYNYDVAGAPAGTLQAAPFPSGAAPTTLASGVGDFAPVADGSLWFRDGVAAEVGTLRFLADRGAPSGAVAVDAKVLGVLDVTRDGGRFLYAKSFAEVRSSDVFSTVTSFDVFDLYAAAPGAGAPCVLSDAPTAARALLSPAGDVAIWDEVDGAGATRRGVSANVGSAADAGACAPAAFATGLDGLLPAGAAAIAYRDEADVTAHEATLRYAHLVDGALTQPETVQTRAAPVFAPLAPALPAVAYSVATGTTADGLYLYVAPAPPDAGAEP